MCRSEASNDTFGDAHSHTPEWRDSINRPCTPSYDDIDKAPLSAQSCIHGRSADSHQSVYYGTLYFCYSKRRGRECRSCWGHDDGGDATGGEPAGSARAPPGYPGRFRRRRFSRARKNARLILTPVAPKPMSMNCLTWS